MGILITVLFLFFFSFHCPGNDRILIGETEFRATYACTPEEQSKGLGYIPQDTWLQNADVMVFRFREADLKYFWMQGMEFPIDILWVRYGRVVKVQSNIPPPHNDSEPAQMNSAPHSVDTVIELPAGYITKYQITEGMKVGGL